MLSAITPHLTDPNLNLSKNDLAVPEGPGLMTRVASLISLAVHSAIAGLCFIFSPTAFVVGAIGGVASALVITGAIKLLSTMDWFKDSFLSSVLSDVLHIGAGVATVITAVGHASGLISGVLCSLGGFFTPIAIYHDVRLLFAPVRDSAS